MRRQDAFVPKPPIPLKDLLAKGVEVTSVSYSNEYDTYTTYALCGDIKTSAEHAHMEHSIRTACETALRLADEAKMLKELNIDLHVVDLHDRSTEIPLELY